MIPILFASDVIEVAMENWNDDMTPLEKFESVFNNGGIGRLNECTKCEVVEVLNGSYELQLNYPITGKYYKEIQLRSIILAKPNQYDDPQPFRVYDILRIHEGIVTVMAEHISYDLSWIPVSPFSSSGIIETLNSIVENTVAPCPFIFDTNKELDTDFSVPIPMSVRSVMGGQKGSLLDIYQGEFSYNGFVVYLHTRRGHNNGVSIKYGKNLTSLEQEELCSDVYTGVFPYYYSETDNILVMLDDRVVSAEGEYGFTRIKPVDMTADFDLVVDDEGNIIPPTQEELYNRTVKFIEDNNIGVPDVSLSVSWVQLAMTEDYKSRHFLEDISLGDTVSIIFEKLGVNAVARVCEMKYDTISERYISAKIGTVRSTIADSIISNKTNIDTAKQSTISTLQHSIDLATKRITGISGGSVVINDSNNDGVPDEILIMDSPSIAEATKVWRWNSNGLGYSDEGYNGSYALAMTIDGQIVADFITSGRMSANVIQTGILQSRLQEGQTDPTFYLNLDEGIFNIGGSSMEEVIQTLGSEVGDLVSHMRFDPDRGLIISSESQSSGTIASTIVINGDRVGFWSEGQEVAYLANQQLYITNAKIEKRLDLGNFAFIPRSNGNLSFMWVGD